MRRQLSCARVLGVAAHMAGVAGFMLLASPAASGCQLEQIAEIPVAIVGNRPVITGQINGQDITLLADTGSSNSTIQYQSTERLGLHPRRANGARFVGVGGDSEAGYVLLDSLKFGGLTFGKLHLFVAGQFSAGAPASDAVLGAEFLSLTTVEFDLAHKAIRLLKENDCKGDEVVYWNGAYAVEKLTHPADTNGKFEVQVTLNGKRARAQLDTGASVSMLSAEGASIAGVKAAAKKAGGASRDEAGENDTGGVTGIGRKAVASAPVKLATFAFDQEVIQNASINVADLFGANKETELGTRIPRYHTDFPAILLGADFFLSHRVLVSQTQGRVYISYIGGPVFQTAVPADAPAEPEPAK